LPACASGRGTPAASEAVSAKTLSGLRGNICEGLSAGYRIFNLNASYTFVIKRVAHVLSLSGQNLNDKLYRNDLSFINAIAPQMGGTVRLNYTLRF